MISQDRFYEVSYHETSESIQRHLEIAIGTQDPMVYHLLSTLDGQDRRASKRVASILTSALNEIVGVLREEEIRRNNEAFK